MNTQYTSKNAYPIEEFKKYLLQNQKNHSYYEYCLNFLNENKPQKITVKTSRVHDIIEFSQLIKEDENGNITIDIPKDDIESVAAIACASIINEFDTLHNEINHINQKIHREYISNVKAAYDEYENAMSTIDISRRKDFLNDVDKKLITAIRQIKTEIEEISDFFSKLPKSTIGKLFSGHSKAEADDNVNILNEDIHIYCAAARLNVIVQAELGEVNEILLTENRTINYISNVRKNLGYARFLEYGGNGALINDRLFDSMTNDLNYISKFVTNEELLICEELQK